MMYRHASQPRPSGRSRGKKPWGKLLALLLAVGGVYAFVAVHQGNKNGRPSALSALSESETAPEAGDKKADLVFRNRLVRSQIPKVDYGRLAYAELFNDSNYVHLSAARANGIDPHALTDPAECDELVPIFSTALYQVDTMYHSVPYLVPEAVLLLQYIASRFHHLMEEHYPEMKDYKFIVTSALRTEESERRLKRVNRNATDTSCHIYGTTFDISVPRYESDEGRDTVVDQCRQMMGLALYELRYEGLCYVKYERGSCFHITLRTTQYQGSLEAEKRQYFSPGSPTYMHTKAPARPKPRRVASSTEPQVQARQSRPAKAAKPAAAKRRTPRKPASTTQNRSAAKPQTDAAPQQPYQPLTDRERLSLDQFERRY